MTDIVRDILADRGGIAAAGAAFGDGFAAGVDRSRRRSYRDDRPASAWPGVFVAFIIAVAVLGGIVLANNGFTFGCDADCSAARANIAAVNAYRDIAVAGANANARAGFGHHNNATQQYAVPGPPPVVPAVPPVVNVTVPPITIPAPVVTVVPAAPVAVAPVVPMAGVPRGNAPYSSVTACLTSLGLREGIDFWSVTDANGNRIDLRDGLKAELQANGMLPAAAACLG